jgi:hypothetical protein
MLEVTSEAWILKQGLSVEPINGTESGSIGIEPFNLVSPKTPVTGIK